MTSFEQRRGEKRYKAALMKHGQCQFCVHRDPDAVHCCKQDQRWYPSCVQDGGKIKFEVDAGAVHRVMEGNRDAI